MRKGFCEDISRHVARRTVVQRNDVIFNMLSDKVILDINMLGSRMEFCILGQCDPSLIVHLNIPHFFQVPNSPKLFEYCLQLDGFFYGLSQGHVFRFG